MQWRLFDGGVWDAVIGMRRRTKRWWGATRINRLPRQQRVLMVATIWTLLRILRRFDVSRSWSRSITDSRVIRRVFRSHSALAEPLPWSCACAVPVETGRCPATRARSRLPHDRRFVSVQGEFLRHLVPTAFLHSNGRPPVNSIGNDIKDRRRRFIFQVVICQNTEELRHYVGKECLTMDVGGVLKYNHLEWVQHRMVRG